MSGRRSSSVVIGPARGRYVGEPGTRAYAVDLTDVSRPRLVLVNGRPLPASGWRYDSATHTLTVPLGAVGTRSAAAVTQVGGTPVQVPEPAATQLTISPPDSLSVPSGTTATVSETFANSGPGTVSDVSLSLAAPSGWTVRPATATTAPGVAAGSSLTVSWSVTAPSGSESAGSSSGKEAATLSGTASYTDDATGARVTDTARQVPVPSITSLSPATASAGQVVTVRGANFGATRGSSYVIFSDDGTNWGAPPDQAAFTMDSWSDDQVTFTVPSPSGSGGQWHVVPGSTATVTVTTANGTSRAATVVIGS